MGVSGGLQNVADLCAIVRAKVSKEYKSSVRLDDKNYVYIYIYKMSFYKYSEKMYFYEFACSRVLEREQDMI